MTAVREIKPLLHTVSATEGAGGKEVIIPVNNIPETMDGFTVHVLGFVFDLTSQVDTTAASMPNAFDGHHVFSLCQNVRIRAGSHFFTQGLDLLHLHKENRIRQSVQEADPSDVPDADDTNVTSSIRTRYMFTHPDAPAGMRYDGAIPAALFNSQRFGDNRISFQVGTAAIPSIAGISVDQITGDVHALCAALPYVNIPPPMRTRRHVDTKTKFVVQPNGPCEWAAIVDRENSSDAFVQSQADYNNFSVSYDSVQVISGKAEKDPALHHNELRNYMSPPAFGTETAPEYITLVKRPESGQRSKMAQFEHGLLLDITDRSSRNDTEVMWREIGLHNQDVSREWLTLLGVPRGEQFRLGPKEPVSVEQAMYMDARLAWPSMARQGHVEAARRAGLPL